MSQKKKNIISTIIFSIIVIAGLSLLLYPTISDWWNKHTQSQTIKTYLDNVETMDTKDYEAELQKAREYNEKLYKTEGALYYPDRVEGYQDILNINGNGIMGYVSIPKIKLKLPIHHGTYEATLVSSVGHLWGSSVPIGGVNTHAVIAAHRGSPSARLFTDIDKLDYGDRFTITIFNDVYIYEVDQIVTISPEECKYFEIEEGKDLVTLQTCTPYGINSHRLLVRGKRVGTTTVDDDEYNVDYNVVDALTTGPNLWVFLGIGVFAAFMVTVFLIRRKRDKKENKKLEENTSDNDMKRNGENE